LKVRRPAAYPVLALLVVGACAAALVFVSRWWSSAAPGATIDGTPGTELPAPVKPAFEVPTPRPLGRLPARPRWAPVLRPVEAHRSADTRSAVVARLPTQTPEGTTNIVLVVGRSIDRSGRLWVSVRLPALPNNRTGWLPRGAIGGYVAVDTHLMVDLERFRATLFKDGRQIFTAEVGVGKRQWPTPAGNFYIRNVLTRYRSPFYGPVAFGTSARSAVLTDWPAGGFVGIHGTSEPQLLPGRVSHGCIRMRNADILRLARLMPVGTPLTIR
jgi:hypothetical protein